MRNYFVAIPPLGHGTCEIFDDATVPKLEAVKETVGGYLQIIPLLTKLDPVQLFALDEEHKGALDHLFGGFLDHLRIDGAREPVPCFAYCNEDGKQFNLAPNAIAQHLWELSAGRPIREDYLAGTIALFAGNPGWMSLL